GAAGEELVPGALGRVAGRYVGGGRQVPRLGVAVAVVADADRTVHVGDDRHRTRVPARVFGERGRVITPGHSAGRVRPVQRLVHREQVRQVAPVCVDQLV